MDLSEQIEGYNLTDTIWMEGYNLMDKSVSKLMDFNVSGFKLDLLYSGYFGNLAKFRISAWIHTEIQDFYMDT